MITQQDTYISDTPGLASDSSMEPNILQNSLRAADRKGKVGDLTAMWMMELGPQAGRARVRFQLRPFFGAR